MEERAERLIDRAALRIFDDPAALADAAAAGVAEAAASAAAESGRFALALSGGSTPRALFRALADPARPFRDRLPWPRIHWFWSDERTVPPDSPESNYRLAREEIFDRVQVAAANVHRIEAEHPDPAAAARAYEDELARFFRPSPGSFPRFDLILLGLGDDGHTASLFPQSGALDEHRLGVAANWVEKLHTFRITLTLPVIDRAARVFFLVAGEEKAAVLAEILEGESRPRLLPAQAVRPFEGELVFWVDRAAASRLRSRRARS
jgi:6-phosphogluconolactonase